MESFDKNTVPLNEDLKELFRKKHAAKAPPGFTTGVMKRLDKQTDRKAFKPVKITVIWLVPPVVFSLIILWLLFSRGRFAGENFGFFSPGNLSLFITGYLNKITLFFDAAFSSAYLLSVVLVLFVITFYSIVAGFVQEKL